MSHWTIGDFEPDEPVWTASEEVDNEQTFEELQLSRMGIDVPRGHEEWTDSDESRATEAPRVRELASQETIQELLNVWTERVIQSGDTGEGWSSEFIQRFVETSLDTRTGNISFQEPPLTMGIDPVAAGLDGAEEWMNETAETETCWDCGAQLDDCYCNDEDGEEEYYDNEGWDTDDED